MHPNTLNLDPDPRFLAQFGSGSRVIHCNVLSIFKEKIKNNFREKLFSLKKSIPVPVLFNNYKNKMSPKEIFTQLSL